jgi:hypothetical protein
LLLQQSSCSHWAFCGQQEKFPNIKEKHCEYINNKRQFGYAVSTEMYQLEAFGITKELKIEGSKASQEWLNRCLRETVRQLEEE